jgi:hypothetical protein
MIVSELIDFLESLKEGKTEDHINKIDECINAIHNLKVSTNNTLAHIDFPSKYLKDVIVFFKTLK